MQRAGGDADCHLPIVRRFLFVLKACLEGTRAPALEDEDRSSDAVSGSVALLLELELKPGTHGKTTISRLVCASRRWRLRPFATTSHLKERQSPWYENGASGGIVKRILWIPGVLSTGCHVSWAVASAVSREVWVPSLSVRVCSKS